MPRCCVCGRAGQTLHKIPVERGFLKKLISSEKYLCKKCLEKAYNIYRNLYGKKK